MLGRGGYLPYKCRVPTPSYSPRQILQGSVPTAVEIYFGSPVPLPPRVAILWGGQVGPPKTSKTRDRSPDSQLPVRVICGCRSVFDVRPARKSSFSGAW